MSAITHHVPDAILTAYAAGSLPHAFSLVVASHVSLCGQCQKRLSENYSIGGVVLDSIKAVSTEPQLKNRVFRHLDDGVDTEPVYARNGIYPGPVMAALDGREVKWSRLGMGAYQDVLYRDRLGTVRLLYIPAGRAVPEHGHNGLEMTLVLQGSFRDTTGFYGAGDLEVADQELEHIPIADGKMHCICLAATDAPLCFNEIMPRILQPLLGI